MTAWGSVGWLTDFSNEEDAHLMSSVKTVDSNVLFPLSQRVLNSTSYL